MASLRRSSAKLRSLGSGHGELQVTIAQLTELRYATKNVAIAQEGAANDLVKWAQREDNRAVKDAVEKVGELCLLWTQAQKEFAESLKEFRKHFEMILEGERTVDAARANVEATELRESKCKKELKKAQKKTSATADECKELSERVSKVQRDRDYANMEATSRIKEHEAVKLIRVKDGLTKLSRAHLDLAAKCDIVFGAAALVADQIPDITDADIDTVQYNGGPVTVQALLRAKERLKNYSPNQNIPAPVNNSTNSPPLPSSPPPYSELDQQPPVNPYYSPYDTSLNSSSSSWANRSVPTPNTSTGLYPELSDDAAVTETRRRAHRSENHMAYRHNSYHGADRMDQVNSGINELHLS